MAAAGDVLELQGSPEGRPYFAEQMHNASPRVRVPRRGHALRLRRRSSPSVSRERQMCPCTAPRKARLWYFAGAGRAPGRLDERLPPCWRRSLSSRTAGRFMGDRDAARRGDASSASSLPSTSSSTGTQPPLLRPGRLERPRVLGFLTGSVGTRVLRGWLIFVLLAEVTVLLQLRVDTRPRLKL